MRITTLVPTMGLIAAAGTAQAFDLASTAEGKLHITGYVDAILEYSSFQQNAPRHGDYDNQALWDTQLRASTSGTVDYRFSGSNAAITYNLNLGADNTLFEPHTSYFGDGATGNLTFGSTITPVSGVNLAAQAPLTYAEVGGITLETSPSAISYSVPFANLDGKNDSIVDFKTTAEIGVSWDINEDVTAVVEMELEDSNDVVVEQAYITWNIPSCKSELQAGKYDTWIAWEDTDPTGLYRVNTSLVGQIAGMGQVTGAGLTCNAVSNDKVDFALSVDVVDGIYGDPYGIKDGNDLAVGLGLSANLQDVVKLCANLNADFNATYDKGVLRQAWDENVYLPTLGFPAGFGVPIHLWAAGDFRENVYGANLQMEIDPDGEGGLLFAADLHAVDYDLAMATGIMLMANYQLPNDMVAFPMAFTLMGSYLDPNDEDAETTTVIDTTGGNFAISDYVFLNGEDDEQVEVALAFLTNPTNSDNFALNFEGRYIMRQDYKIPPGGGSMGNIEVTNRNEFGIFVELLAILP